MENLTVLDQPVETNSAVKLTSVFMKLPPIEESVSVGEVVSIDEMVPMATQYVKRLLKTKATLENESLIIFLSKKNIFNFLSIDKCESIVAMFAIDKDTTHQTCILLPGDTDGNILPIDGLLYEGSEKWSTAPQSIKDILGAPLLDDISNDPEQYDVDISLAIKKYLQKITTPVITTT